MVQPILSSNYCFAIQGPCPHKSKFSLLPEPSVFFAIDTANPQLHLWESIIQPQLKQYNFSLHSYKDNIPLAGEMWCNNICRHINRSAFIIADIGNYDQAAERNNANPNVMLELGWARAHGKQEILISNSHTPPTNLSGAHIYTLDDDLKIFGKTLEEYCKTLPSFTGEEMVGSIINVQKKLLDIEKLPGERYYNSNKFSILTRPKAIQEKVTKSLSKTESWTHSDEESYSQYLHYRVEIFEKALREGPRYVDIYPVKEIKAYLETGKSPQLDLQLNTKERIKHIERILQCLESPFYDIIFSDIDFHFLLKPLLVVAITSERSRTGNWSNCIVLTGKQTVDNFRNRCEFAMQSSVFDKNQNASTVKDFFNEYKNKLSSAT